MPSSERVIQVSELTSVEQLDSGDIIDLGNGKQMTVGEFMSTLRTVLYLKENGASHNLSEYERALAGDDDALVRFTGRRCRRELVELADQQMLLGWLERHVHFDTAYDRLKCGLDELRGFNDIDNDPKISRL